MLPPVRHIKPLPLNPKCQWSWKRILWLKWGLLYCCFNCLGQCFSRLQQWPQPADSSRQMLLYQKNISKFFTQHLNMNSSTCTCSHSGLLFGWLIYVYWGLDDLYEAGFLRSLLGLLAACSVDPTLDAGSQGTTHRWLTNVRSPGTWCDGCKE